MVRCVRFHQATWFRTERHIRMHGAFEIPHETLGIKHTDQSCHHEVWIHLLHVNARFVDRASRDGQYRRPIVKKMHSPCDHKYNHVAIHARTSSASPCAMRPPRCSVFELMCAAIRSTAHAWPPPRYNTEGDSSMPASERRMEPGSLAGRPKWMKGVGTGLCVFEENGR